VGRLSATRFVDEHDWGFGWVSAEQPMLRLTSHALVADGGVWLTDPSEADGVEERIRGLGEPAGVLQLLDRHNRACAAFAERLGVPHHRVPFDGVHADEFGDEPAGMTRQASRWRCADRLGSTGRPFPDHATAQIFVAELAHRQAAVVEDLECTVDMVGE